MKAIMNFLKRALDFSRKVFAAIARVTRYGIFAFPQDQVEKFEVLQFIYKTLTIVLAVTVLFSGVWLAEHGYPSWPALLLFALRLLYALPAKRVERALRKHQYEERERTRASHSSPRRTPSV